MSIRAVNRAFAFAFVAVGLSAVANAQTMCSLTCPANMTLASLPGQQLSAPVNYAVPVPNGCVAMTATQTSGIPPGGQFAVGTTTNVFVAGIPNEATCQFTVTVTATPALPVEATGVPVGGAAVIGLLALLAAAFGVRHLRQRG